MAHHESTVEVPASPEDAFALLSDRSALSTWDPTMVESAALDPDAAGVGARYRVVAAFFGRRIELDEVIERHDAPQALVVVGRNKNVEHRTQYTIERRDGGARITTVADLKLKGAMRILDKGLQVTFTNVGDRAADGLRRALGG
jgi:hypothetical protein